MKEPFQLSNICFELKKVHSKEQMFKSLNYTFTKLSTLLQAPVSNPAFPCMLLRCFAKYTYPVYFCVLSGIGFADCLSEQKVDMPVFKSHHTPPVIESIKSTYLAAVV